MRSTQNNIKHVRPSWGAGVLFKNYMLKTEPNCRGICSWKWRCFVIIASIMYHTSIYFRGRYCQGVSHNRISFHNPSEAQIFWNLPITSNWFIGIFLNISKRLGNQFISYAQMRVQDTEIKWLSEVYFASPYIWVWSSSPGGYICMRAFVSRNILTSWCCYWVVYYVL